MSIFCKIERFNPVQKYVEQIPVSSEVILRKFYKSITIQNCSSVCLSGDFQLPYYEKQKWLDVKSWHCDWLDMLSTVSENGKSNNTPTAGYFNVLLQNYKRIYEWCRVQLGEMQLNHPAKFVMASCSVSSILGCFRWNFLCYVHFIKIT